MNKLPPFFNYKEDGKTDNGYESLQDFFLSWTLRCSPESYKSVSPMVQEYARRIIYVLIHGHNTTGDYSVNTEAPNNFQIRQVQTRRQLGRIDLIAEVIATENGVEKRYLLNIENKWYSGLGADQLEKYKRFVTEKYPNWEIVNLFITCDNCRKYYDNEKEQCRLHDYKYLTIDNLASLANIEPGHTGNALFDEYWFD